MIKYAWILMLLFSFLLIGCNTNTETEPTIKKVEKSDEENDEKTMSDEHIKDIIKTNLDKMEDRVQADFDESLMPIDENTFAAGKSSEKTENIVDETKEDFEHLVAANLLDEWVRCYLYSTYVSYHREYLNSDEIQTRFEVLDQSDDHFEVSFITLENEGGISYLAGTQHLHYIKENEHWVIEDIEFITPDEKPLNLTFDDLKEYYSQFNEGNLSFEAIEETEIDGVTYLVYKIDNLYYARNVNDSMYNYEIIKTYNRIID